MKPLIVNSQAMYELIIQPHFSDLAANFTGYYNGSLSEFTVADEVSLASGTPLIDLFGRQNILQRKDASCKTNWSQVMKGKARKIVIEELYGATEDCQEEFYQGCLKDFAEQASMFRDMVLDRFKKAIGTDIATNSYFGDVTRAADPNGKWSWNKYDGIFTKYAKYIADANEYTPVVMDALGSGTITPSEAYAYFKEAFDNMTEEMRAGLVTDLAYFCDWDLARGLHDYYVSIGNNAGELSYIQDGIPVLKYNGIPVFVEPTWKPVLTALNGGEAAHALILTFRGNFVFGTNKKYGGGMDKKQGLRVWWSEDDEVWRQKMHLAAGVEIASPQNSVFGMTDIS